MPRIKSAIKRVDVAERNREKNRHWKAAVRTVRNKVDDANKAANVADAETALKQAFSVIDRAVAKGVLHENTAARRKSRMVKSIRRAAPKA